MGARVRPPTPPNHQYRRSRSCARSQENHDHDAQDRRLLRPGPALSRQDPVRDHASTPSPAQGSDQRRRDPDVPYTKSPHHPTRLTCANRPSPLVTTPPAAVGFKSTSRHKAYRNESASPVGSDFGAGSNQRHATRRIETSQRQRLVERVEFKSTSRHKTSGTIPGLSLAGNASLNQCHARRVREWYLSKITALDSV